MTDKDKKSSIEDEMKALEKENAAYIDDEPKATSPTPKSKSASKQAAKPSDNTSASKKSEPSSTPSASPEASSPPKASPTPEASTSYKTSPSSSTEKSVVNTSSEARSESRPAKTGMLWFFTVFNLLLLIALVGAGYWAWMQWQNAQSEQESFFANQETALSSQLAKFDSQNSDNDKLRSEMDRQASSLQNSVSGLEQQLSQTQLNVAAIDKKLDDVSGRRPSDWLLAEADYLVRMAGRKLWLEHDVKTAVLMLQSADSRLQDIADPSLLPIRQYIANDIQSLLQVNQVSLTSLALALSGMIQQVDNLPLSLPEVKLDGPEKEDLTGFERFLRELTDNFKYQSNDKPLKPLLDQQQQWLAREQLKYSLLLAQSAVLKEQGTLLQQSVQQSIGLLVDHYDLEQTSVNQFITSLQNIEKTEIERNYPSELQSALPLKDLMESRLDSAFSNGKFEL